MAALFGNFGAKSLSCGEKFVCNIHENPNSPQADKPFFPNLYKLHYLYVLMYFYLVPSRRVCLRNFPHEWQEAGADGPGEWNQG
jgi:hypothetical protein